MAFKMTKTASGNFGGERKFVEIWGELRIFSDERYVAISGFFYRRIHEMANPYPNPTPAQFLATKKGYALT